MREYSKIGPQFWIGKTGKVLRRAGVDAQLVGLYLLSSPHANMLGLYYLAQETIGHETGIGVERAVAGLKACISAGFCSYDEDSEMVWVHEMAFFQIAEKLLSSDKRSKGVQNEYNSLPDNPFLAKFHGKYAEAFCMTSLRGDFRTQERGIEGAYMGLASQEQEQAQEHEYEQAQEQEQAHEQKPFATAVALAGKSGTRKGEPNPFNLLAWQSYKAAYAHRYGVAPVQNAKSNSIIKQLVQALGAEAEPVAAFYVMHNDRNYVVKMHQLNLLLADHAKLRTEWATNQQMTSTKAQQADKTATNLDAFAPLIAAARAREEAERNDHAK